MAIIELRAWYLEHYEPLREVTQRPHDLRLSRSSLLKSGLRADFLDDRHTVEEAAWFQRYLTGETVEFYLEGSGSYAIANLDLVSHEIYFAKQDSAASLEPTIFFSYQQEYAASSEALQASLQQAIVDFNRRSRLPLSLVLAERPEDAPLRLSANQLRAIRKSLLFIADGTPIGLASGTGTRLLSPYICVELGYALQCKQGNQILLAQLERLDGMLPFDLPGHQQLLFQAVTELPQTLPSLLEGLLKRFNLLA
ncbi:MAG: hypothetical protein HC910_06565 [Spirulinaceae cyanobacterium SM2_1_0]|nr:hypothetical protein [Spirulinaceae cyanobacterium SM2_1_0]